MLRRKRVVLSIKWGAIALQAARRDGSRSRARFRVQLGRKWLKCFPAYSFGTSCFFSARPSTSFRMRSLAYKGGDSTAYETGHVTLDPLPHIRRSPIGMVLVPLISYVQLGWMVGFASVPFNAEWGGSHPRRQALMSLAGPLANCSWR